ncbi:hypothetical protein [Hymenobacter sp. YC55]|uniref:hypothetical protein n=1 Tax=Hymenobacter sp. YC55 TaxID=3034019 RepID=UPI0023F7921B|nr:hypothetical protein [Hymenobacter sp. YC55]MDF7810177.1 hypothetical protein [Hymenobacter sp. YC55]
MEGVNASLLSKRASVLPFYSPYNFLRDLPIDPQTEMYGAGRFARFPASVHEQIFTYQQHGQQIQILYTALPWDSEYFGVPTFKLLTGLFDQAAPMLDRVAALHAWQRKLAATGGFYCFSEIPVEDTTLLQTLTSSGWRLIETRMQFYHNQLEEFRQPRYAVRAARLEEAEHIGQIAAAARNSYDRFHADMWFGATRADAFLARYASAAVQGYCDTVLVPNEPDVSVDSFLAISDLVADASKLGVGLSRVVLTAVGPQNKGWHQRLVSETVYRAREQGARYVLMTTQATNRAVFRTCEKLGFRLGGTTHILACHHAA